jgi:hypothetical protein
MAIQVTCPGCLKRFSVSEKFAGKEGPCPQCKAVIKIPTLEEQVIIHAPEHSEAGAVGAGGRHTLKTFRRKDTKFKPVVFAMALGAVLVTLLLAFLLRGTAAAQLLLTQSLVAVILGPPLAWAGYQFLYDAELEPHAGVNLLVRSIACGLVFALLWGAYKYVGEFMFADADFQTPLVLEMYQMAVLSVLVLAIGTFAAYVSFDLEPISAFFNCALFFAATVLLRLAAGLPALPGLGSG